MKHTIGQTIPFNHKCILHIVILNKEEHQYFDFIEYLLRKYTSASIRN